MEMNDVISEIKLLLTGGVLELEIPDTDIEKCVKSAIREIGRYWDETTMVTVPFSSCIDLEGSELDLKEKASAIVSVYRTESIGDWSTGMSDPMYMQQWMLFSNGGTMYNLNDYVLNYASWVTLLRIKNTISTDMAFKQDMHNNKLYINEALSTPGYVTIEYIPKLEDISQIKTKYWGDALIKMSVALTKIVLGRIRTRYTQTSALWTQDGEKLLEEGRTELTNLREMLTTNDNMILLVD